MKHHIKFVQVLFCGRMMQYGFQFTKEELDNNADVVQCDIDQVALELRDTDICIPLMCPITRDMMENAPNLKCILQFGAGVEAVDMKAATSLGIYVSNIPSAGTGNATSCAEMAIFLTLATLRNINEMNSCFRNKALGVPIGSLLQGSTILVLGFGGIAKELIIRLHAFKVKIRALRRSNKWKKLITDNQPVDDSDFAESLLEDKGIWPQDTARLASTADIIVITCKQDESNKGMVNDEFLRVCKHGVKIVNVARGGLLDYSSILQGLNSGKIGGMGLDVQFYEPFNPDDPIACHPAVYMTPHVAGITHASYRAMAKVVAEETKRIQTGLPPSIQLNDKNEMKTRRI